MGERASILGGVITGRNSVVASFIFLLRSRLCLSLFGFFGAMMPRFIRHRAAGHEKHTRVVKIERFLREVGLLHYNRIEGPIAFVGRREVRFGRHAKMLRTGLLTLLGFAMQIG